MLEVSLFLLSAPTEIDSRIEFVVFFTKIHGIDSDIMQWKVGVGIGSGEYPLCLTSRNSSCQIV